MKKILILNIFAGLILAGCAPENPVSLNQNSVDQKIEWLGNNSGSLSVETELTLVKTINGSTGGIIEINETLGKISIKGSLTIPGGAFPENQNISISFNDNWYYQEYQPSPLFFRTPLILNLVYKNVSLMTDDPLKIGFYYITDAGKFVKAEYESLLVDPINNTLGITGAKIPHFSRWGWAKSTE